MTAAPNVCSALVSLKTEVSFTASYYKTMWGSAPGPAQGTPSIENPDTIFIRKGAVLGAAMCRGAWLVVARGGAQYRPLPDDASGFPKGQVPLAGVWGRRPHIVWYWSLRPAVMPPPLRQPGAFRQARDICSTCVEWYGVIPITTAATAIVGNRGYQWFCCSAHTLPLIGCRAPAFLKITHTYSNLLYVVMSMGKYVD